MAIILQRIRDDIYVGRDPKTRRLLGSFVYEGGGSWYGCLPSGQLRHLTLPGAPVNQVARRMFAS